MNKAEWRKKKRKGRWTAWSIRYANNALLVNDKVFHIQMILTSDNHPTYRLIYFDKVEHCFSGCTATVSFHVSEMWPRFSMKIVELLLSLNVDKWDFDVHLFCSTYTFFLSFFTHKTFTFLYSIFFSFSDDKFPAAEKKHRRENICISFEIFHSKMRTVVGLVTYTSVALKRRTDHNLLHIIIIIFETVYAWIFHFRLCQMQNQIMNNSEFGIEYFIRK